jgi:peptide/nickel transport system permease protein
MNLRRYLLRKVVYVIVTVFFIATLNFFIFQVLPGDPTRVLLPRGCGTSNISVACQARPKLLHDWGLDQPVTTRFVVYLSKLLHGDLGTSITYQSGTPVWDIIAPRLWTTLILVGVATAATMWLGLVLGRISGWRRGRKSDVLITMSTLSGYSMPSFWMSLILIFALVVTVPIFPLTWDFSVYLHMDPLSIIADYAWHLVLPVITFVLTNVAWFSLTLRNSITDVLPEDYMVTAAAKGLTESEQLRRHALPNARLPFITASALYFGWILSGAIVIEVVFTIEGLGQLTWAATTSFDGPLLSAIFLIATLGVVAANAVADILYMVLDPRVREA